MIRKGRKDNKGDSEKREIRISEHRSSQGAKEEEALQAVPREESQEDEQTQADVDMTDGLDTSEGTTTADTSEETAAGDLQSKANEYLDHLQRLQAEFENYRKRMVRERDESWRRARGDLILSFIPFIDDIRRLLSTPVQSTDAEKLVDGVKLIERNIMDFLQTEGLEEIEAMGKPFDPTLHEALEVQMVDDEERDGFVADVLIRGYKYKNMLLRPVGVKVSKFINREAAEETQDEEDESSSGEGLSTE